MKMKISIVELVGLLLIYCIVCTTFPQNCHEYKNCSDENEPVCGEDSFHIQLTFRNKCVFNEISCNDPQSGWKLLYNFKCKSPQESQLCQAKCPLTYDPVCGEDIFGDRKVFDNKCFLESKECTNGVSWMLLDQSECDGNQIEDNTRALQTCNLPCTETDTPVCALQRSGEFVMFKNQCEFNNKSCTDLTKPWITVPITKCVRSDIINIQRFSTANNKCVNECTKDLNPICARDRANNTKEFENLCLLEFENCYNLKNEWKIVKYSECRTKAILSDPESFKKYAACRKFCPHDPHYVCARNFNNEVKIFKNKCMLEIEQCYEPNARWTITHISNCTINSTSSKSLGCYVKCDGYKLPVCGINKWGQQKTFIYKCFFDMEQCEHPESGWNILSQTKCNNINDFNDLQFHENCKYKPLAACSLETNSVCARNIYGQVTTFPNSCVFKFEKCNHPKDGWYLVNNSMCARKVEISI